MCRLRELLHSEVPNVCTALVRPNDPWLFFQELRTSYCNAGTSYTVLRLYEGNPLYNPYNEGSLLWELNLSSLAGILDPKPETLNLYCLPEFFLIFIIV